MKFMLKLFTLVCLLIIPAVVMAAPTVTAKSPADGAIDVEITTPVTATFSEAMKEGSITSGSLPFTRFVGIKAVAAGNGHTVAVKGDGNVIAWGSNGYGQTDVPVGLTGVVAVAAGYWHTVALKGDGTVVGWGRNTELQISIPAGLTGVVAVAAGAMHTVALKNDGTVVAWGANGSGESSVPAGLAGVVAVAARESHTVALKNDGKVVAWGNNYYGQISVPADLTGVTAVAAGGAHTMALKGDGTLVAWGFNNSGQTSVPAGLSGVTAITAGRYFSVAFKGDGTVVAWGEDSYTATEVPVGLNGVVAVSAGWYHTVALKSDATIVAWGDNSYGQAIVPASLTGVVAVSASPNEYSIALKSDGKVVAWGWNSYGQASVPAGLTGVVAVAAGGDHNVALKGDGTVVAWGSNNYFGQTSVPAGLTGVTAVAAGGSHAVALKNDGTVSGWGSNGYGESSVPVGLNGVIAVAAGQFHTLALKGDGTVVAWGGNQYGNTVPAGLSGVVAVAAGYYHNVALKSDGTVVAWGLNQYGQSSVPEGLTGVTAVSAGYLRTVALKGDGTVVVWGNNPYGLHTVPAGLSGVVAVSAGDSHTVALKSDGTVVAWGINSSGQTSIPFDPYTVPVVAAISYDPGSSTATITPTAPLLNNTTYTATVTTGVKNVAGTAVAADTSWSFKTVTKQYNLTFATGSGGSLSGNASQSVNHGDSATAVTAVPGSGYHFVNWTGTDGFTTTIANPLTLANVTSEYVITANFAINTYNVSFASGGNGTLTGTTSQTINYNASAAPVTAVPAIGYHFVNWTGTGGFVTTTDNPLTVANVTAAQTITANFAINTYNVTFVSGGNGTFIGTTAQTVNYNDSLTSILAVPATGYAFANWTGTGGFVTTSTNPLTVMNVMADQTITANFVVNAVVITKDATRPIAYKGGKGTLSFTASSSVTSDNIKATIAATPWITADLAKFKFAKGKGSLPYAVALNSEPTTRSGTITIGNDNYAINQEAHPCVITAAVIDPSIPLSATGGVQSIDVNVEPNSCQWKVVSYKIDRDVWFSNVWGFPVVNVPLSGDQKLIGTVPANTTGKALSNTIVIMTMDGKSKKSITLKQANK